MHHQAGRSLQRPIAGHGWPQLVSVGCEGRYFDPLLYLSCAASSGGAVDALHPVSEDPAE